MHEVKVIIIFMDAQSEKDGTEAEGSVWQYSHAIIFPWCTFFSPFYRCTSENFLLWCACQKPQNMMVKPAHIACNNAFVLLECHPNDLVPMYVV